MKHVRRLFASGITAAFIAVALIIGTARLDVASKKGGGDAQTAICDYYWSIITYPYVSPTIQAYTLSLYLAQGCTR